MEKSLEKHMTNVLNNHGVTGMICVDKHGLCLGVKGNADTKASGCLAAISQEAEKIIPNLDTPVVCIESSSSNILIKSHEDCTTAIYKHN
ncbi:LAMTOR5 [Bugula neritina]|uniref:Late endosomal/lysosomal adaptor and MAPK and MTOR activator 5 n=1 Tax=Bugula neritina TaxID=10212 RepID=A0A7J7K2J8_BUGNE|nr:LAMTOR5 [Bugula neritina]